MPAVIVPFIAMLAVRGYVWKQAIQEGVPVNTSDVPRLIVSFRLRKPYIHHCGAGINDQGTLEHEAGMLDCTWPFFKVGSSRRIPGLLLR